jgi:chromosome segregation ATPase
MSARSTTLVGTNVEHFEQLSRERDALLQTSKQADRDREHALARLQELRASQKKLSHQVHVANETLGVVHRELTMYKNEQARLEQVMQQERAEIQQCVDEGNELRAGESQRKRDFCKSMDTLNKNLADLLMQQEDIRLQKMIAVESAPVLLSYFLAKTSAVESENRDDFDKEAGVQALANLHAAISDLANATDNFQDEMSRKKGLEEMVQQLRSRALQQMSSKDGAPQKVRTYDRRKKERVSTFIRTLTYIALFIWV